MNSCWINFHVDFLPIFHSMGFPVGIECIADNSFIFLKRCITIDCSAAIPWMVNMAVSYLIYNLKDSNAKKNNNKKNIPRKKNKPEFKIANHLSKISICKGEMFWSVRPKIHLAIYQNIVIWLTNFPHSSHSYQRDGLHQDPGWGWDRQPHLEWLCCAAWKNCWAQELSGIPSAYVKQARFAH